ncbi:MAG: hypothetical protein AAFO04_29165 [Cyanobacteria bacterium J06592_8]
MGLKPILRKVWSPMGDRPTAVVSHRYEWLYVYGFVKLKTGETFWYLISRVNWIRAKKRVKFTKLYKVAPRCTNPSFTPITPLTLHITFM